MKKILIFAVALFSVTFINSQTFTSSTSELNNDYYSGGCVGVTDMDMDGYDDIIILTDSKNLYIEYQNSDGTFSSSFIGAMSSQNQWGMAVGDIDNDGHCDVMCGGNYDGFHIANINDADNHSISTVFEYSIFMQGLTLGDFNNDGWLDAIGCHDDGESAIWGNNGAGELSIQNSWIDMTTTPSSDNSGNYGSVYCDVDNDGDLDIYIAKCRQGVTNINDPRRINALFINDGNNNYTNEASARGLAPLKQSWTSDFMDIDNDGDFDCFLTNHDYSLMIFENDGNGYFTDITPNSGFENVSGFFLQGKFEDFDNDGFVDLLYSGGSGTNGLYHNNGDNTFSPVANNFSDDNGLHSFGIGDLNHDGFPDFYASYGNTYVNPDYDNQDRVWFNDGNNNNWITFQLEGVLSNTSAIGAKVTIYGDWGVQVREVRAGESYGITNSFNAHFGLGSSSTVDFVTISWPAGGMTLIENPEVNQFFSVVEQTECENISVSINNSGSFTLCPGVDELVLAATASTDNIIWSNGESSNPISIQETGSYFAIAWDENGCATSSEAVNVEVYQPQTPAISTNGNITFCNGGSVEIAVIDPLSDGTYTWSDGTEASSIIVTESGNYTVALLDFCENTTVSLPIDISAISVEEPQIDDEIINFDGTATFESDNENTLWYENETATEVLYSGLNYTTEELSVATSFWAQAFDNSLFEIGSGGKTSTDSDGHYHQNSDYWMIFDAEVDMVISTVRVFAEDDGNRTVIIEDASGTVIYNESIFMPEGESVVELNASVPAGIDYSIKTSGNPGLWRDVSDPDLPYPYNVGGIATITGTSITSGNWNNYYYFFYDWQVETNAEICYSEVVEVIADLVSSVDENNYFSDFSLFPNPVSNVLKVSFISQSTEDVIINIYDQVGRVVVTQTQIQDVNNEFLIDVSTLSTGFYTLSLTQGDNSVSRKIIVE